MEPSQGTEPSQQPALGTDGGMPPAQPVQSVTPRSNVRGDVVFSNGTPKKNLGMIVGMVILAIIAVAGVAFGIIMMTTKNDEVAKAKKSCQSSAVTQSDEETCTSGTSSTGNGSTTIVKEEAENLIAPYVRPIVYGMNIFNYDFDSGVKIQLAFDNLNMSSIYRDARYVNEENYFGSVSYDTLNAMYRFLFGNGSSLSAVNYGDTTHYTFEYVSSDGMGNYKVKYMPGGGTGSGMVTAVRNAYYNGDDIVVEVYSDMVPWCATFTGNADYCVGGSKSVYDISDMETQEFVETYGNRVPVYQMTFTTNAGHYVLNKVEKVN